MDVNDDPFADAPIEDAPATEPKPVIEPEIGAEAPVGSDAVAEAPVAAPETESAPEASAEAEMDVNDASDEAIEGGDPATFATVVPMSHPDGGSCDLFEERDGKLLVPSDMVETMASHGFVVDA